jgi:hypothetical protein
MANLLHAYQSAGDLSRAIAPHEKIVADIERVFSPTTQTRSRPATIGRAQSRQRKGERSLAGIELRCDLKWISCKA